MRDSISRKLTAIIACFLCMMIIPAGCAIPVENADEYTDEAELEETTEYPEVRKLPEILFIMVTDYSSIQEEDPIISYVIYDKEGNYCELDDPEILSLSYEELNQKYRDGTIADKLTRIGMIDNRYMWNQCINDLNGIVDNPTYSIDVPEDPSQSTGPITVWYGFYYNDDQKIQRVTLFASDHHGDYYSNDKRSADIPYILCNSKYRSEEG